MSRSAENQNWAILAQHHYAQETKNVIHGIFLLAALSWPAEVFKKLLDDVEAGL